MFDIDLLDDDDPFEIDSQAAHLFKHAPYGIDDVYDVWDSQPLFYPATPPDPRNSTRCRPIGCYLASIYLADQYRRDR